ncbi:MAG: tRNA pseudouridine(38-40) synthase TruA [Lachnospiraceae bacterium]|nr:tRNA pseudouridine(38-40) synthase TruA [Lachnospiraceae bacterium]
MRRILLRVSYDGTNYHGFQEQPNAVTIEGELNKALSDLNQTEIHVIGASRTDAGVHAYDNVAVFDTELRMSAEKFVPALNTRLPDDIVIQSSEECESDFHPRKCDCKKTYEYRILARKVPLPEYRNNAYFFYRPLDIKAMERAAIFFKGRHDFNAFCSAKTVTKTTIRTIYNVAIREEKIKEGGRLITISITGNGFLYNMVRIIAGTLLQVGIGAIKPTDIPKIIMSKERENAGPTAPPQGLKLKKIEFKGGKSKKSAE